MWMRLGLVGLVLLVGFLAESGWTQDLPTPAPDVAVLPDEPEELNLAWSIAQAHTMESGDWQRHIDALYANESVGGLDVWLYTVFAVMDLVPTGASLSMNKVYNASVMKFPTPTPNGTLDRTLKRGYLLFCAGIDRCTGEDPTIYMNDTGGTTAPTGSFGDQFMNVVSVLGQAYGVPNLTARVVCSASSQKVYGSLLERRCDLLMPYFGISTLAFGRRRNVIAQQTASSNSDFYTVDKFFLLPARNVSSVAQIFKVMPPTARIAVYQESARQHARTIFPQLPASNFYVFFEDPGNDTFACDQLVNGYFYALYGFTPSCLSQINYSVVLGNEIGGAAAFTRRSVPLNVSNPNARSDSDPHSSGNEALALAIEAAWAIGISTGARKVALSQTPNAAQVRDISNDPSTLPFPSFANRDDRGTLWRILKEQKMHIGELAKVNLPPYFVSGDRDGAAPTGSVVNLIRSILSTISNVYSVPQTVDVEWKYYETPELLFTALRDGEIDLTAGMAGMGNWFEAEKTVDYLAFRKLPPFLGIPINYYHTADSSRNFTEEVSFYRWFIGTSSRIRVGIPSETYRSLILANLNFAPLMDITVYDGYNALITAVQNKDVDVGLMEENRAALQSGLPYFPVAYRPVTGFVRRDPLTPPRVLDYVHWSNGASIAVLLIMAVVAVFLLVLAGVLASRSDRVVVTVANLPWLLLFLFGYLLITVSLTTYIGHLNKAQCVLRPWFLGLGTAVILGCMLGKSFVLLQALPALSTATLLSLSAVRMFIVAGGVVLVEVVFLIVWSTASPLKPRIRPGVHDDRNIIVCTNGNDLPIFYGIQIALFGALLVALLYFNFRLRGIISKVLYRQPQFMFYSVWCACCFITLFALASGFLWNRYLGHFIVVSISVLLAVAIGASLLFGTMAYLLLFSKEGSIASSDMSDAGIRPGSTGSSGFSSEFKFDSNMN